MPQDPVSIRATRVAILAGMALVVHHQETPVLSPEQQLQTFRLPQGYTVELVASEPLVEDPVAIDIDADGRLWVVEMRAYMPNLEGTGEDAPIGRVVVLEDEDDDGRMDRKTVYLDSLVLPRAVKVLDRGVLVGVPPYLWLVRDTNNDLRADTREVVRSDYGVADANPEHIANAPTWGLDNWVHHAHYPGQQRFRAGSIEFRPAADLGQWGVGMDEYGRLYRNFNEDPLHADLVPSHYYARNRNLTRSRGAYEDIAGGNQPVWPAHATPAINRGYRVGWLRADSTLARFTAAGSPVVYVGDRLPAELRGNAFVTEPAGNLVHRFVVTEQADGRLHARSAYERSEFLASTHDRFRPVNLYSAPDGTLYVVDMYRGIIQHRAFVTGYLEEQVRKRGLEQPIGLGRIWRVVHESTRRERKPQLTRETAANLVNYLSHPNGWWRITAQRLLVERGDASVAPALRQLAVEHGDARVRLHALWTLDGLGTANDQVITSALADPSPHVRAAGVRIAETRLTELPGALRAAVLGLLRDSVVAVRWQAIATLGAFPAQERIDTLSAVLARDADRISVDVAISGLEGLELTVLRRLLQRSAAPAEAISRLAATVVKGGDPAQADRLVGWIGQATRPREQRIALLDGFAALLPPATADDPQSVPAALLKFVRRPAGLLAAAGSNDPELRDRAARVIRYADWPGKPAPARRPVRPLTGVEQRSFAAGRQQYQSLCAACHLTAGTGIARVGNRLAGSKWVNGPLPALIRIVLHGKEGEMLMPPVGGQLSDAQIADVLTYIRRAWGNQASPITAAQVYEIRGATLGRSRPWTEAELERLIQ